MKWSRLYIPRLPGWLEDLGEDATALILYSVLGQEKKIPRIFSGRRGLTLTVGIVRGDTSEVAGLPVVGKVLVTVPTVTTEYTPVPLPKNLLAPARNRKQLA